VCVTRLKLTLVSWSNTVPARQRNLISWISPFKNGLICCNWIIFRNDFTFYFKFYLGVVLNLYLLVRACKRETFDICWRYRRSNRL
jgi:hypothetical protein